MRKKVIYGAVLQLMFWPTLIFAQSAGSAWNLLKEEQKSFTRTLKSTPKDSSTINPIARNFETGINYTYAAVKADGSVSSNEKDKAYRSIAFFVRELRNSIEAQKIEIYDIPVLLSSYKNILNALIHHKPVAPLLEPLSPKHSQVLVSALSQYKEYPMLDDVTAYKRISSSPEYILQFLESKPGFRFADSLLLDVAANDPLRVVYYLNRDRTGLQDKIRNTNNAYLKQIVALSQNKNASELIPFVMQIADTKMTVEEILEKRTNIIQYYQLLVNTLQESIASKDSNSIFLKPLRNAIKQKSLAFFVNPINDLHNSSDAVRFASIKDLRPEDVYYIITSCGEDLYTSSYLGLYKRLVDQYKDQSSAQILEHVKYDKYRAFVRLAANYNVLADYLSKMRQQEMVTLLKQLIAGIEGDTDAGLEAAMDIADCFAALSTVPETRDVIETELLANLNRCKSGQNYLCVKLYNILYQVFALVKQDDDTNKLWATLGNYDVLKRNDLENKNGEIVQLVLFYGDEDGVASFSNFMKLYADPKKWEIAKNENWVSIRSIGEKPLLIYANLPLSSKDELDIKAQDILIEHLSQQSLEPTVLVHRGHSYHLDNTLKRLTPSVKLAILGSCGGYNKGISIAHINPDIQFIGSKKTGAKSVNDPILYAINETLVKNEDISWTEIWSNMTKKFSKDEATLNLFNEYFPPNKNVSLFVLKLFMYEDRFVFTNSSSQPAAPVALNQ